VRLRDLDDTIVPRAAAKLGALARGLAVRRDRVVQGARGVDLRDLRALDERYARSGPLAVLRELPQLGFVLIGVVFLAGAGLAVSQENARERRADQNAVAPLPSDATSSTPSSPTLGPVPGDSVEQYRRQAEASLTAAGQAQEPRVALVSFASYRTPTDAVAMLRGFTVQRVYLRAAKAGPEAAQLPVNVETDLPADLGMAYARIAQERLREHKSFKTLAASVTVATKSDREFKQQYLTFATTTGVEAREYNNRCACVYAAVVSATPALLRSLRARPQVRAVEVAGAGLRLSRVRVLPLLPDVTGVVPAQQAGPGQP
jgi:hypothetical protein